MRPRFGQMVNSGQGRKENANGLCRCVGQIGQAIADLQGEGHQGWRQGAGDIKPDGSLGRRGDGTGEKKDADSPKIGYKMIDLTFQKPYQNLN